MMVLQILQEEHRIQLDVGVVAALIMVKGRYLFLQVMIA